MSLRTIAAEDWYETIPFADEITLIHEPWIKPFYRCNMWHVKGSDRDLLVDTGLGAVSLVGALPFLVARPLICLASHTHFDHIGCHAEFAERLVHPAEADILADPTNERTLASPYATDAMFDGFPPGWISERYRIAPAPATGFVEDGDSIDLGNRSWRVIHTPGHSPGGIALFEERTGTLIAGDILYDGPLVTDTYHSDLAAYRTSLASLRDLPVRVVHGGHFQSFGRQRYHVLIDDFLREFP